MLLERVYSLSAGVTDVLDYDVEESSLVAFERSIGNIVESHHQVVLDRIAYLRSSLAVMVDIKLSSYDPQGLCRYSSVFETHGEGWNAEQQARVVGHILEELNKSFIRERDDMMVVYYQNCNRMI